jgi:Serine dehydratase beta chain
MIHGQLVKVGPMRAGKIFVESLKDLKVLDRVRTIKIVLYGALAATGKGHMSPQALLMGLEGKRNSTVFPLERTWGGDLVEAGKLKLTNVRPLEKGKIARQSIRIPSIRVTTPSARTSI